MSAASGCSDGNRPNRHPLSAQLDFNFSAISPGIFRDVKKLRSCLKMPPVSSAERQYLKKKKRIQVTKIAFLRGNKLSMFFCSCLRIFVSISLVCFCGFSFLARSRKLCYSVSNRALVSAAFMCACSGVIPLMPRMTRGRTVLLLSGWRGGNAGM